MAGRMQAIMAQPSCSQSLRARRECNALRMKEGKDTGNNAGKDNGQRYEGLGKGKGGGTHAEVNTATETDARARAGHKGQGKGLAWY